VWMLIGGRIPLDGVPAKTGRSRGATRENAGQNFRIV